MLPPRIPKKAKLPDAWRTSASDGDFNQSVCPETLRNLIAYDPETGAMHWKRRERRLFLSDRDWRIWNTRYADKAVIGKCRGYQRVRVLGIAFAAHRVAWAIHYGEWPGGQIDHINGVRDDNRISNLRVVTNAENSRNIHLPANNTSGRIGVSYKANMGKWRAEICVQQKRIYLGSFPTFEAACEARHTAERKFGFHPNHGARKHG